MTRIVEVSDIKIGGDGPLVLIAGPCVIEGLDQTLTMAERLVKTCTGLGIPIIFKSSFDKANRTSADSFRGPGLERGLEVLAAVKDEFDLPVTSDVHDVQDMKLAAEVLDLIQIPAFLCRQTSLLEAAAGTGLPVNVKKGQFLAPWDVRGIIGKVRDGEGLLITERGSSFGYNNLVVDFRSLPVIRDLGIPVVYDATHSLQLPGGLGDRSGGMRQYIPHLCRAAVACGIDALFMEVHPEPDSAPCDGPNMWPLDQLEDLLISLQAIRNALSPGGHP
ncbi:MAG: 3-deoxy-8-phosphooctulonate synthase [bacterium]|nr:MAG: 3-deoxy-8-phosphooctulonate synthase [bacterium]